MPVVRTPTLKPQHQEFLISQVATFAEARQRRLAAQLASAKFAEEYGFSPIRISHQAIGQFLRKPEIRDRVNAMRLQWSSDVYSIRLGNKSARISELVKLYESVDTMKRPDGKEYSAMARAELKQQLLRHIKEEVGEDVEKLADAMRTGARQPGVVLNFWEKLSGTEQAQFDRDLAAVLGSGTPNRL